MRFGKTTYNRAKSCGIVMIAAAVTIIGFMLSAGYGAGHSAISHQQHIAQQVKQYQPSHLTVIYERTVNGKQDFLHLKIDTTYHTIGKGNYTHEVLCDRDFSLRAFDGDYYDCGNVVEQCFIEGNPTKEWQTTKATKRVAGNECRRGITTAAKTNWEAWYTDQLPHIAQGTRTNDPYKGLILELRDADGKYELKARYITQYIG